MSDSIDLNELATDICNAQNLELLEFVDQGSYKLTFKVLSNSSTLYALKIYKSPEIDNRSKREIDVMLRCNHPGIAKIKHLDFHVYQEVRFLFLIEEFFGGGTLADILQNRGVFARDRIVALGNNLSQAISYLADKGLVHRDIKPANILFRENSSEPILTDFGIVRDLQATSETKTWLPSGPGTPFFASPEQLINDKKLIDWRADQFSLGITLALCAFGQHPFAHNGFSPERTVEEVAKKGQTSEYFQQVIHESNLTALATMVSTWPANRYRTVDLLLEHWNSQGG